MWNCTQSLVAIGTIVGLNGAGVGSIGILVRVIGALIGLISSIIYWRKEFLVCSFDRTIQSRAYWCEEWEVCTFGNAEDVRSVRMKGDDDYTLAEDAQGNMLCSVFYSERDYSSLKCRCRVCLECLIDGIFYSFILF